MAKLYWRVKKNDRWTWEPQHDQNTRYHPRLKKYVYRPSMSVKWSKSYKALEEE